MIVFDLILVESPIVTKIYLIHTEYIVPCLTNIVIYPVCSLDKSAIQELHGNDKSVIMFNVSRLLPGHTRLGTGLH